MCISFTVNSIFRISGPPAPNGQLSYYESSQVSLLFNVKNSNSTLTIQCQWEDETVRERTGHPPSYAEAKKMKSLILHTHGCSRASLRDWSSSPYSLFLTDF